MITTIKIIVDWHHSGEVLCTGLVSILPMTERANMNALSTNDGKLPLLVKPSSAGSSLGAWVEKKSEPEGY